jgi:hypothetical protein
MKKLMILSTLIACNSNELTAPKFNAPPHIPTGEASMNYQTDYCPAGKAFAIVTWDIPRGTMWNARFLIQRAGTNHPVPADYVRGIATGKMSGCSYSYGDKASAEIWKDNESPITVEPITIVQ